MRIATLLLIFCAYTVAGIVFRLRLVKSSPAIRKDIIATLIIISSWPLLVEFCKSKEAVDG